MRTPRRRVLLFISLALSSVFVLESPRAQSPPTAQIYGIGDLDGGGIASAVRDATRVGGVIYAVGASTKATAAPAPPGLTTALDTPVLWSSSAGGVLTELPSGIVGGVNGVSSSALSAYAITQTTGQYIATVARYSSAPLTNWSRVDRLDLGNATANLSLGSPAALAALAISDDGNVLYGVGSNVPRRRQLSGLGTGNTTIALPALPGGTAFGFPIPRGTSDSGHIMVGVEFVGSFTGTSTGAGPFGYPEFGTNTVGFRYRHTDGTTTGTAALLPPPENGATWNYPIALSRDGLVTLAAGNTEANRSGEVYLIDNSDNVTLLGSPNTGAIPRLLGGMTDDGAVVVTFSGDPSGGPGQFGGIGLPTGIGSQSRIPYLRNGNGWVLLASALRELNMDLESLGWDPTNMAVTGVRTAGGFDLVFGQGRRRTINPINGQGNPAGPLEGFVIEITAGFLAGVEVPVAPPSAAAQSLLGAWVSGDPLNPAFVSVYLPDGRQIGFTQGPVTQPPTNLFQNGFELATYSWGGNGTEWRLTHRLDMNGLQFGQQGFSAVRGRFISITGDNISLTNDHCSSPCPANIPRLVGPGGSIVGAWRITTPFKPGGLGVLVLMASAHNFRYFLMSQGGLDGDGFETGNYTLDGTTLTMTPVAGSEDPEILTATLSRDELSLDLGEPGDSVNLTRIVDPAGVVPVFNGPLTAVGTTGEPFTFNVTTRYAQTTAATGLPPGLGIDANTGQITGTPTAHGVYNAQLSATNTFGLSTNTTLTITVKSQQSTLTVGAPTSAMFGETFTATPIGGDGSGGVTFVVSGVCSNTNGEAQITMTSGTGSCFVHAEKAGDANYYPTSSETVTVTAAKATQAALTATAPPTAVFGESFTAGATGGSTGGSLTFAAANACSNSGGSSTVTMTSGTGACAVTATMAGDNNYQPVTSDAVIVTAAKAPQGALGVSAPPTAMFGDSFTATRTGGGGSGTDTFVVSGVCSNSNGGSQVTMTSGTGTCLVHVENTGDANYEPATSGAVSVTAAKATQAALTATAPPTAVFGESFTAGATGGSTGGNLTFAATNACSISGGNSTVTMTSGTGTCAVTATMAGNDNYQPVTSAPASVTATKAVQAALTVTGAPASAVFGQTLGPGFSGGTTGGLVTFAVTGACSHLGGNVVEMTAGSGTCSIAATMAGNDNYQFVTSPAVLVTAAQSTSTTTVNVNPSSDGPGQAVTFIANISPQWSGYATGTVSFKRGGTTLGTANLSAGVAQLVLTNLGVGTHVVSATYGGDSNVFGSSSTSSVTVTVVAPAAPSTTTIASSLNPSMVGQQVTFTATVTSATPGTPSGTITFKQGPTSVAVVPLSGGQAMFSTSALPAGTTGLTATYSGDATYLTSTSASITQSVNKATTTTALVSSVNPSNVGDSVTFTVTVTASGGGAPGGTVTLKEGNTVVATVTLDASGVATFTTSSLTRGRHNIKALYAGDAAHDNSTSAVLGQVVR